MERRGEGDPVERGDKKEIRKKKSEKSLEMREALIIANLLAATIDSVASWNELYSHYRVHSPLMTPQEEPIFLSLLPGIGVSLISCSISAISWKGNSREEGKI